MLHAFSKKISAHVNLLHSVDTFFRYILHKSRLLITFKSPKLDGSGSSSSETNVVKEACATILEHSQSEEAFLSNLRMKYPSAVVFSSLEVLRPRSGASKSSVVQKLPSPLTSLCNSKYCKLTLNASWMWRCIQKQTDCYKGGSYVPWKICCGMNTA